MRHGGTRDAQTRRVVVHGRRRDGERVETNNRIDVLRARFSRGRRGVDFRFARRRRLRSAVRATSQTPRRALRVTGAFDVFTTRLRTVFRADGCSQCHATFGAESREKSDEFGKNSRATRRARIDGDDFVRDSSLRRRIVGGVRRVSRASGGRRGRRVADVIRRVTPERIVEAFTATRGGHGKSSRRVLALARDARGRE